MPFFEPFRTGVFKKIDVHKIFFSFDCQREFSQNLKSRFKNRFSTPKHILNIFFMVASCSGASEAIFSEKKSFWNFRDFWTFWPCKSPLFEQIRPQNEFGDFGHPKKWLNMGSKRSKIGRNFDFLTFLVILG